MPSNISNLPKLAGKYLTLRYDEAGFKNEPDVGEVLNFDKHDCFELTGRAVIYSSSYQKRTGYMKCLVEGSLDDSKDLFWLPVRVSDTGADHEVHDKQGRRCNVNHFS